MRKIDAVVFSRTVLTLVGFALLKSQIELIVFQCSAEACAWGFFRRGF
jgi:hypothetical protein